MKISIIIPTIRKEKLLDFQLLCFSYQTFPKQDFEIIIIDDYVSNIDGTDRKDSVIEFGKQNNLNIKWMKSKQHHYRSQALIGNARNTGLIHAQGELIIFNDDFSGVRKNYLQNVWNTYKNNPGGGYSHIGPVISVEYVNEFDIYTYKGIDRLRIISDDNRSRTVPEFYGNKDFYKPIYKEHRSRSIPCLSGWFYTSNASAPLDLIIKVNGFWEMADLTREEDVLMGLALERLGWKFCYSDDPEISVYHMVHHDAGMRRYVEVSYDSIGWPTAKVEGKYVEGCGKGGRCGLNTNSDNIQLVTRDVFQTVYPGSWALIEKFKRNDGYIFNSEIGFNLVEERKKIGL